MFSTSPQNIDVLRQRIVDTFNALRQQPDFIRRAVRDMHRRAILCVERNGGHEFELFTYVYVQSAQNT